MIDFEPLSVATCASRMDCNQQNTHITFSTFTMPCPVDHIDCVVNECFCSPDKVKILFIIGSWRSSEIIVILRIQLFVFLHIIIWNDIEKWTMLIHLKHLAVFLSYKSTSAYIFWKKSHVEYQFVNNATNKIFIYKTMNRKPFKVVGQSLFFSIPLKKKQKHNKIVIFSN